MKAVRFVAAAVVITIISFIVFNVGALLDMSHYTNPDYFPVWSKIMMPVAGAPPIEFILTSLTLTFITSLIFVFIYTKISALFDKKSVLKKGVMYGFCFFVVSTLLSSFSLFLLINLPAALIVSWALQGLVSYVISGIIVAKLMK